MPFGFKCNSARLILVLFTALAFFLWARSISHHDQFCLDVTSPKGEILVSLQSESCNGTLGFACVTYEPPLLSNGFPSLWRSEPADIDWSVKYEYPGASALGLSVGHGRPHERVKWLDSSGNLRERFDSRRETVRISPPAFRNTHNCTGCRRFLAVNYSLLTSVLVAGICATVVPLSRRKPVGFPVTASAPGRTKRDSSE